MEILGCGMVHPNVFELSGVNNKTLKGFAFGMGIERLSMLKYGMPDLREFYESNLKWLHHYGFSFLKPLISVGGKMKFTIGWLKDYLEFDSSIHDLCNKLN